jgi:hypothetical protein
MSAPHRSHLLTLIAGYDLPAGNLYGIAASRIDNIFPGEMLQGYKPKDPTQNQTGRALLASWALVGLIVFVILPILPASLAGREAMKSMKARRDLVKLFMDNQAEYAELVRTNPMLRTLCNKLNTLDELYESMVARGYTCPGAVPLDRLAMLVTQSLTCHVSGGEFQNAKSYGEVFDYGDNQPQAATTTSIEVVAEDAPAQALQDGEAESNKESSADAAASGSLQATTSDSDPAPPTWATAMEKCGGVGWKILELEYNHRMPGRKERQEPAGGAPFCRRPAGDPYRMVWSHHHDVWYVAPTRPHTIPLPTVSSA